MCKPRSNLCISLPGSIHASNNKITCHVQATLLPRREDRSIIALIQTIVFNFVIFEYKRTNCKTHVDCFCIDRSSYSHCGNQIHTEECDRQRGYLYHRGMRSPEGVFILHTEECDRQRGYLYFTQRNAIARGGIYTCNNSSHEKLTHQNLVYFNLWILSTFSLIYACQLMYIGYEVKFFMPTYKMPCV